MSRPGDGGRSGAPAAVGAPAAADALPLLLVNGRRASAAGRHLSAFDRGATLADGVFETMRVYGGAVFRLDAHLARLAHGAALLEIPVPPDARAAVLRAVAAARERGAPDAGLRLTLTRGPGPGGAAPSAAPRPTLVVAVTRLPDLPPRVYADGISAQVASGRRNEHAATSGIKALAYTDAVLAAIEARRAGADDALLLDTAGHCSEGASSNIFAWTGDALVTPPLSCGALPGITRAAVLELAGALGIATAERVLSLDELRGAGEAFLTSSLREIAPLVRLDGRAIGAGAPGPVTRRVMDAFASLVRRECAA